MVRAKRDEDMSQEGDHRNAREPWVGLPETRPRRRRASLDRDGIVAAAIRVIDVEGADALSMRRLGVELGSGATSVYRHVRDKEELIGLAFDAITGEIPLPDPGASWEDALVASARGLRDLFQRHRGFVLVIGRRAAIGPRTLELLERLLGILRAAGFPDQAAYHAISAIANYATGFTVLEMVPGLRGAGGTGVPEYRELVTASLKGLPPDAYPNTAAVAPQMVGKDDEDFEYGVSAIVAGIRSLQSGPDAS
jgi:AcrR family transcriptional regulator